MDVYMKTGDYASLGMASMNSTYYPKNAKLLSLTGSRWAALGLALGLATLSGCDREQPTFKETEAYPQSANPLSLSREFVFAESEDLSQDLTISTSESQQKVTLDMATEEVVWTNAQRDRRVTDSFRQGSSASQATESFKNLERSPVDILFVVDSSSSMKEEQSQLATKLSAVLGHIQSADWRLAVVSADDGDDCSQRKVIKKDSADPASAFKAAVSAVGLDGDDTEKGVLMAVNGLKSCEGSGWLRENSAVATVIVSDEDNCSNNGRGCRGEAYGKAKYLTDYLDSIRTLGTTAKVYGIIKRKRSECRSARHVGRQYLQAIEASGGIAGSICADDYSDVLSKLSQDLSETLIHNLNLSHEPIDGATTVWVDDRALGRSEFRISGSTIVLTQPLQPGQLAKVSYTYRPEPLKTRFALSQKPQGRTVAVAVNGQAATDFRVAREEGVHYIAFDSAPQADAKIVASYRNTSKLKTTFVFDQPMGTAREVKVSVNGRQVNAYDIDRRRWQTRLTFDSAPEDGAKIKVAFARELHKKLRYELPVTAGELLGVRDERTGAAVDGWLEDAGRTFVISDDQFAMGRRIVLDFRLIAGVSVALPETIDLSTLKISRAGKVVCQETVDVNERTLDLLRCRSEIGDGPVQVSYTRRISGQDFLFVWPNIETRDNAELKSVTVTVNEQAYTDFAVEGNGIRFTTPLQDKDRIYVRCDYAEVR